MKYEADAADLIRVGRAEGRVEGIEIGMTKSFSIIKDILRLSREGKTAEYIAAEINMPIEYVEETLDMVFAK